VEPIRETQATLVDLLDRVLEKGLVIQADLIVSVAGIPLIGVNLRAAIAGMETMVKYGLMSDWDEAIRAREGGRKQRQAPALEPAEEILASMLGSKHCVKGIYKTWRPGRIFLTNERLILYQKAFDEVVFHSSVGQIEGLALVNDENSLDITGEEVRIVLCSGELVRIRAENAPELIESIESVAHDMGHSLGGEVIGTFLPRESSFLVHGEELLCESKMWHLARPQGSPGLIEQLWRPGNLYLTGGRLIWVSSFESRKCLEVESERIMGVTLEQRRPSGLSREQQVLDLVFQNGDGKEVASFAGTDEKVQQWHGVLEMVSRGELPEALDREMESCPACGGRDHAERLLGQGCSSCGWVSPRAASREAGPQKA